jgi:hypothetical protein
LAFEFHFLSRTTSEPKGQELVYIARIKLDQPHMLVDGKQVNLTPGMAVTAEIKTAASSNSCCRLWHVTASKR